MTLVRGTPDRVCPWQEYLKCPRFGSTMVFIPYREARGANSETVRHSMNVIKPAVAFKFLTREAID
jgi:hypothetical protein